MTIFEFLGEAAVGFWLVSSLGIIWITATYGAIVVLMLIRRMTSGGSRHAAALNAALAKHTWQMLDERV